MANFLSECERSVEKGERTRTCGNQILEAEGDRNGGRVEKRIVSSSATTGCSPCPRGGIIDSSSCEKKPSDRHCDRSCDGLVDGEDKPPDTRNADQNDAKMHRVSEACDTSPVVANPDQSGEEGDSVGDLRDDCPNLQIRAGEQRSRPTRTRLRLCLDVGSPNQEDLDADGGDDTCGNCIRVPNLDQPHEGTGRTEGASELIQVAAGGDDRGKVEKANRCRYHRNAYGLGPGSTD